ncbi:MAG: hypothetical protein IJA34_02905 [Lachnospiraceae bacterium]|nr:hypothetical protein [Lachnospiraceae bacterium]
MCKKRIIISIVFCICIIYIGANLYCNNKKASSKDLYNSSSKSSKEFAILDDIRKSVDDVKDDIKSGAYSNLSGEDISVYISDGDKICSKVSEYLKWEAYEGITDPKDMLEYELSLIQFFLGTDLNPKYLLDASSLNEKVKSDMITMEELEGEYPINNYDKVCNLMENGSYISKFSDGMPRLGYSSNFELGGLVDEYRYALYISGGFDVQKGNLRKIISNEMAVELCKSYSNKDENIDDKYVLIDGSEVSIKDCFDTAVKYLEKIPYKGRDGIKLIPIRADVFRLSCIDIDNKDNKYHNKYFVDVIFTREYDGMYMDFGDTYEYYTGYDLDSTYFTIIKKGEVEEVIDYNNRAYFEDIGEKIDRIISLDNTLDILNNSIGNNSKYEVINIGLVYRRKNLWYDDGNVYEKYELTPKWRIDCISEINDETRSFYIDVLSGTIEYVQGMFGPIRYFE